MDSVKIKLKDLYQLLISTARYAYTRNNHLMPSSFYEQAKRLLVEMKDADPEWAVNTAKQLCDECISDEIQNHFYDGIDDEYNNLYDSREFVKWLLDFIANGTWKPYNYSNFEANLKKDDEPRYNIYKVEGIEGKKETKITDTPVSQNNFREVLFKDYPTVVYSIHKLDDKRTLYTISEDNTFRKTEDFIVERIK